MSQEQQPVRRPVTYKDVFGEVVQGEVAAQPVTVEDAALMQSAETMGLGKTRKGGAAAVMQAAADKNVRDHIVDPASHSDAAECGFGFRETIVDGKAVQQEYVGQQPVSEATTFVPTLPEIAATQGITIGEALEEVAVNEPDKVIDKETARAIQSAESRATGIPVGLKGGLGATAQSAAQKNVDHGENITIADVLDVNIGPTNCFEDATQRMLVDKVVTKEDVEKLKHVAEGDGGAVIAAALQEAFDANAGADRYIESQQPQAATGTARHEDVQQEVPPRMCAPEHVHVD